MSRVPEWADCAAMVDAGAELTTLQKFVYDNEPEGFTDRNFRIGLEAILEEAEARGWQARAALEKGK